MTFEELRSILDDKNKTLTKDELCQVIYELKQDTLHRASKIEKPIISEYDFYIGESNAFQIVLALLEHLV